MDWSGFMPNHFMWKPKTLATADILIMPSWYSLTPKLSIKWAGKKGKEKKTLWNLRMY